MKKFNINFNISERIEVPGGQRAAGRCLGKSRRRLSLSVCQRVDIASFRSGYQLTGVEIKYPPGKCVISGRTDHPMNKYI